ncbi:hypothetical protein DSO57_1035123 [Entomophthora muscae]|uniref:Uncharacterized protein n=1 Tax=Entomophthora muscae TaxID=34485 RepID=A0ACC2U8M3_9FUNG|nr:hypothetical protein DSO57_1035123 [Entomophthora muscae]
MRRHPLARSRNRLDAFNFNKLKNNNFGYRDESRTLLNCSVCLSGVKNCCFWLHTRAILQLTDVISSPLTITLHEWLLSLPKNALPRWVLSCLVLPPHVATSVRNIPAYTPATPTCRPTVREIADQRNAEVKCFVKLNILLQKLLAREL